jgi:hypothetical protein
MNGTVQTGAAQYLLAFATKTEKVAFLGVSGSPLSPVLREQLKLPNGIGMVVDFVEPKSPADEVGLKQYDILQKLDDQLIVNAHQLAVLVRMHKPGDEITLTVIHRGDAKPLKAKLIEKELAALDDRNPWGVPPGPWENPSGATFNYWALNNQGMPVNTALGTLSNHVLQAPPGMNFISNASANGGTGDLRGDVKFQMQTTDDKGTLVLLRDLSGETLLVKDREERVLDKYPLNTEEERSRIPAAIRENLKRMEGNAGFILHSTTQPSLNPVRLEVITDDPKKAAKAP